MIDLLSIREDPVKALIGRTPDRGRQVHLPRLGLTSLSPTQWLAIGVIGWAAIASSSLVIAAFVADVPGVTRLAMVVAALGMYAPLIGVALNRRFAPVFLLTLPAAGEAFELAHVGEPIMRDMRNSLMLATVIVAGAAAYRADRRVVAATLGVYFAAKTFTLTIRPDLTGQLFFAEFPATGLLVGLMWVVGAAVRRRQAAELRVAELAEQAQLARERERSLLARELHDVVAHELTIIAMQATLMRMSTEPDDVAAARQVIEETSRRALDELKRLLLVLRTSDVLPETAAAQQASVASVVQAIAEQLRGLGHEVTASCQAGALPRSVELAADRVLRETATNIVKHSPEGSSVSIEVVDDGAALSIVVANTVTDHRARGSISSTHLGLPGLEERLSLLRGTFSAGREGDRWVVRSVIPHRPGDAPPASPE